MSLSQFSWPSMPGCAAAKYTEGNRGHKDKRHKDLILAFSFVPSVPLRVLVSDRRALVDDVLFPTHIVARREVAPEMTAAALHPAQRRARDQARDGREVSMTRAVDGRRMRSRGHRVERGDGMLEPRAIAKQSDGAPHEIGDWGLGIKDWKIRCPLVCRLRHDSIRLQRRGARRVLHGGSGARAEDEPFEKRVAREAVRAAQARAGPLAPGQETPRRRAAPDRGIDAAHDGAAGPA